MEENMLASIRQTLKVGRPVKGEIPTCYGQGYLFIVPHTEALLVVVEREGSYLIENKLFTMWDLVGAGISYSTADTLYQFLAELLLARPKRRRYRLLDNKWVQRGPIELIK